MLSILLAHNYYRSANPSGENVAFEAEAALLSGKGHEVRKYVRRSDEIADFALTNRAKLGVQMIWSRRSYSDLTRMLLAVRPDVAHFHNTFPLISTSGYLACQRLGVPVVQTLHNYRPLCLNGLFLREGKVCQDCVGRRVPWPGVVHRCYRKSLAYSSAMAGLQTAQGLLGMLQNVDLFIAPSEFLRTKYLAAGFPGEKIVVKPNFVDVATGPYSKERGYALFIGRMSTEKGAFTLINAWKELRDIPLILLGDGPEAPALKAAAQQFSNITFAGAVSRNEVLEHARHARYLVLPSECYESSPMVLLEAFACSTPVIASNMGAPAQVVINGRNGLLYTPRDADDLARKARYLWSNPEHAAQLGKQARLDYEAKFAAECSYEQVLRAYRLAIKLRQTNELHADIGR
jgi:glycosyltransferase involved in cell wall biosynthesis